MRRIAVTNTEIEQLVHAAVEYTSGEHTELRCDYRGRRSPNVSCVAYQGSSPSIVTFELAVILVDRVDRAAAHAGYNYTAHDVVDELRLFVVQISSPFTESIGTELLYYWPTVHVSSNR